MRKTPARLAVTRCVAASAACIAVAVVLGLFFGGRWWVALGPAVGTWMAFPIILGQERRRSAEQEQATPQPV